MSRTHPPTLFIAGNCSGVGKTTMCVALMRRAIELGGHPAAIKPIDVDCHHGEDHDLISDDGLRLAKARGHPMPPLVMVPYRFVQRDSSPLEATRASGLSLRLDHLEQAIRVAGEHGDVLFVELPGPVDGPITEDGTGPDLVARINAPLLLMHGNTSTLPLPPFSVQAIIVNEGSADPHAKKSPPSDSSAREHFSHANEYPPFPRISTNVGDAALQYVQKHRLLEQLFAPAR